MAAASRAADRDRQRREKQRLREYQEMAKQHALADAADTVARYEEYVEAITSVHRESTSDFVDWEAIAAGAEPPRPPRAPARSSKHENAAVEALAAYTPGMIDRMFGRGPKRLQTLQDAVAAAAVQDDADFRAAEARHDETLADHDVALAEAAQEKALGARVLAGDLDAFEEVLGRLKPFSDLADFGSEVDVSMAADEERGGAERVRVSVRVRVLGKSVIPAESRSLLSSGKLSTKKLAASAFHDVHQDYVCGCVLRVANELLAVLPVSGVIVSATDEMLNPATGHIEDAPVVSVYAPRKTMERLNLAAVDPSDALANFLHRMSFRKTTGFSHVKALAWEDVPADAL